jgi:hypothetical protein
MIQIVLRLLKQVLRASAAAGTHRIARTRQLLDPKPESPETAHMGG